MLVSHPGDAVVDLVKSSRGKIVIVSPYIKSRALQKLIDVIPQSASHVICITRWLPADVASGVCDIEIFDDMAQCNGELRRHPRLHAKFYSNSDMCLVGSANLTSRGFGYHTSSNIELLVKLPCSFSGVVDWESELLEQSTVVSKNLRDQIFEQANAMKESMSAVHLPEVECPDGTQFVLWLPTCPEPDYLWPIYQGKNSDSFITTAYNAAKNDLAILAPPEGLSQELFEAYISKALMRMPFFIEIDDLASTGISDSRAQQFLSERLSIDSLSARRNWDIAKRWFTKFLAELYWVGTDQEVVMKGKKVFRH